MLLVRLSAALVLVVGGLAARAAAQSGLRTIETRYYTLHTDLDDEMVQEATLRISLMAEEYQRRTQGFAGTVKDRLPFFLFAKHTDYVAAGGHPQSAGLFGGGRLMACLTAGQPRSAWHTIQHEGFHQFLIAAVGERIPIWANEGLAEYFGEGQFTGDNFIIGLIPPARLARIKAGLREDRFPPLREMMTMSPAIWSGNLSAANYDQAWSMVYFLVHAPHPLPGRGERPAATRPAGNLAAPGRYQTAFTGFLADVSHQQPWDQAWVRRFGKDVDSFEERWREYWTALPDEPTADLYAEALVCTCTSFFGRAVLQRQSFENFEAFAAAARDRTLKTPKGNWLPPQLLLEALDKTAAAGTWSLEKHGGRPLVVCLTAAGTRLEGSFRAQENRVQSVSVHSAAQRK